MSETGRAAPARAVVDRDECFGFAYCVDVLPQVFALDEHGKSVVRDVAADPDRLALAVGSCPRAAISLVKRDTPLG